MVKNKVVKLRFILLLIAAIMLVLCVDHLGFFAGIDSYFYDTFLRLRGSRTVSDRIVIVAIDADSLKTLGKWPLQRSVYAVMLDRIDQADVVGFDLLLMEPSDDDGLLAAAIKRHGRVVLADYVNGALTVVKPLEKLGPYAMGHIHIELGIDNTAREVFHSIYCDNALLPSITSVIRDMVSGDRQARQKPPLAVNSDSGSKNTFQQDLQKINYYGPPGTFRQISLADVISGTVPPAFFKGRIVLVGLTAPGIVDEVSTPFSQSRNRMSGVEVHANILNNLLDKSFIKEMPDWMRSVAVLVVSLVLALLLLRLNERNAALAWISSLVIGGIAALAFFFSLNIWLLPTAFYASFCLMYLITYLYRLDSAARKLDKEHDVIISLLGWDAGEIPGQSRTRGLFGFLSEGGINEKIQRQLRMTNKLLTLHKQLEVALKMEREALDNQVRLVEMLSHEYRTPLAIIRANLDILEMKDGAAGGMLANNFGKMKRAMSRLVEVMDVSLGRDRLDNLHLKMERTDIQLAPFIRTLLNETGELWSERRLELDITESEESIVVGDRSLFKTALLNLIDNAIKYSAENEPVCVSLSSTNTEAFVRVKNFGVPIPAADLDKVFEKFYRGTGSGNTRGAGLGLYLVRKIIEQFNGSVTLTSSESEGTVATVALPLG